MPEGDFLRRDLMKAIWTPHSSLPVPQLGHLSQTAEFREFRGTALLGVQ